MRRIAGPIVGCGATICGIYAAGAVITLALILAGGATLESWPQVLAMSLGWPVMLLMLVIFVLASLGAPH